MPLKASTIKRFRAARAEQIASTRKKKADFNFTPTVGHLNFKSSYIFKEPHTGTDDDGGGKRRQLCDTSDESGDSTPWYHKYGIRRLECYLDRFNRTITRAASENDTELLVNILRDEAKDGAGTSDKKAMGQALLYAMHNKNLLMMEALLKAGASPKDYMSTSPMLMHAIDFNQYDIMDLLLEYGCDANVCRGDGSALHLVSRRGNTAAMEKLIAAGANIHTVDIVQKVTPLGAAAQANRLDAVEMLLRLGVDADATDCIWGRTGLHWAIYHDNMKMVDSFLKHGADPLKGDLKQLTTLMLAINNSNLDMVKMLTPSSAINFKDDRGKTALHKACESGNMDIVQYLLSMGADVNAEDNEGNTALMNAVILRKHQILHLLAPHSNVNHVNKQGRMALHLALEKNSICRKLLDTLLKIGADVNARYSDDSNKTALMVHYEDMDKLTWLLQGGADPNLYTDNGQTAVWFAAHAGRQDCVKVLLEYNACMHNPLLGNSETKVEVAEADAEVENMDTDDSESEKTSPLQEAISGGHTDIIKLLVIAGCPLEGTASWLKCNSCAEHDDIDFKNCMQWLRKRLCNARTLQDICRMAARTHCGHADVQLTIAKLPLPTAMKKYLTVPELNLINEILV